MYSMKRFIYQAALFGLVTGAQLVALNLWIGQALGGEEALKHRRVFESATPVTHMVLGNSKVVHGIDPRFLDGPRRDVHNLGFNGASPLYYARWYQAYRKRHPAPRWVLMEADWFLYRPVMWRRLEHDSEFLPPDVLSDLLKMPDTSFTILAYNRFPLLKHRETLVRRVFAERKPREVDMAGYYKGYVPLRGSTDNDSRAYQVADDPNYEAAFRNLVKSLLADGVRVVFVQAPEYLPLAKEHPAENGRLAALAAAHGVPMLNYNTERRSAINEDRSLFCDWSHLNEAGSRQFSERLSRDLTTLGLMP